MFQSSFLLSATLSICGAVIVLKPQAYLRLPNRDLNYEINSYSAGESAYDSLANILYVLGKDTAMLHVIDVNVPSNPSVIHTHLFQPSDGTPLDVELCRADGVSDKLAITFDSFRGSTFDGHVTFYKLFTRKTGEELEPINPSEKDIPVGPHPDNMKFSSTCLRLVVANEGEPRVADGVFVDPQGSVSIVNINPDDMVVPVVNSVEFTYYDSSPGLDELLGKGVRYWLRRNPIDNSILSLSQNLEPEYVAISPSNGFAYVTLQENNAIVRINLEDGTIAGFYGMGTKSWDFESIDANDQDGVNPKNRKVTSLYQPDKVTFLQWNGIDYLFTADEGRPTSVPSTSFQDYIVASQRNWNLADTELENELKSDAELGRAHVSIVDGDGPVLFGGRGFSIWNTQNMMRTFDSSSELETISRQYMSTTFNGDCCDVNQTPAGQADQRSTWMGPEVSAIAVGNFSTRVVMVVGSGRNGLLYVYSMQAAGQAPTPEFQSVHRAGAIDGTWQQLYDRGDMGDAIISDIKFTNVPNPLVMVTSAASSSVSFYTLADEQWPLTQTSAD